MVPDGCVDCIMVCGEEYFAREEELYAVCQSDDGKDYRVLCVNGVKVWVEVPLEHVEDMYATTVCALLSMPLHKMVMDSSKNEKELKKNRGRPKKEVAPLMTGAPKDLNQPKKIIVKKLAVPEVVDVMKKKVVVKKVQ